MSNQLITEEGYQKIKKELEDRTTNKRQEIAARIESAKELGDLSENAEYHEAKDEQAFNEGRIMELTSTLKNVTIVQNGGSKTEVSMGSKVTVDCNGIEKKYVIVSFNEADPASGKISNESPLGLAFSGKKKGDKVVVNTPRGQMECVIKKIE
jgi:transcription elongation factor GreA